MEQMRFKEAINYIIKHDVALHTPTQAIYDKVVNCFDSKGYKWGDGKSLSGNTNIPSWHWNHFEEFKEDTTIRVIPNKERKHDDSIWCCPIQSCIKDNIKIIELI